MLSNSQRALREDPKVNACTDMNPTNGKQNRSNLETNADPAGCRPSISLGCLGETHPLFFSPWSVRLRNDAAISES
eukprot:100020-Pelagomonas_calceolata.AAC.1